MPHDFNRPFVTVQQMESFTALQDEVAARYGRVVKAVSITNREYGYRYAKLASKHTMKPPPGSVMKIFPGYLVVRKLGTKAQYETWIPDGAFEEMYEKSVGRKEPNQSSEPTPPSVTPRAGARVAPAGGVAHL